MNRYCSFSWIHYEGVLLNQCVLFTSMNAVVTMAVKVVSFIFNIDWPKSGRERNLA
jgi:hypothetical protein